MTSTQIEQARSVAVLIPAYNEAATIEEILRRVDGLSCVGEIVLVDDCSADQTVQIAEGLQIPRLKIIRQHPNQGKTAAVRRGLSEVTCPVVIIQDADLEYDPDEIPVVVDPILTGKGDVVYGSRFLVRKTARVLYFYHYLANRGLTFLCNLLTNMNMTDIETCYKAFRTPIIQQLPLTSKGFGMEVEITAMIAKTRAKVFEVPISYYGRTYQEGKKIGMKDGLHALWYIFYYNVIAGRSRRCREYVKAVNQFLAASPSVGHPGS